MADNDDAHADRNVLKAPKDKNCPYCGQAFTSSSLGRHLDLYIKEKNAKPPDGIHDVEEIRQLRGGVTRRTARASGAHQDSHTPTGTPVAGSRAGAQGDEGSAPPASSKARFLPAAIDSKPKFPFIHGLEATGVINNIPTDQHEAEGLARRSEGSRVATPDTARRTPVPQRGPARQALKGQLNEKQRTQDALDTARAAELALREIVSSLRAAKQHIINTDSTPFDFDPLSLDFPALCLQCLPPPPTLFASTQLPTPTSWSIAAPGKQQRDALKVFFDGEFRKWKIACASITTAVHEELTYPPSQKHYQADPIELARKAEQLAEHMEQQVAEHLKSAYSVWEGLPAPRRNEVWVLELARSSGRKQNEIDGLKQREHDLRQENTNLNTQVEHLNRLQQPREYKLLPPTTIPVDNKVIEWILEEGTVRRRRNVGMSIDDRHLDLSTVVTAAIERWKAVVVAGRSGMSEQRSLDQETPSAIGLGGPATPAIQGAATLPKPSAVGVNAGQAAAAQTSTRAVSQNRPPAAKTPVQPTAQVVHSTGPAASAEATSSATPAASVADSNTSANTTSAAASQDQDSDEDADADADADAEMEDDAFQEMSTPIVSKPPSIPSVPPLPSTPQLQVPRTRTSQIRGIAKNSGSPGNRSTRSVSHATPAGRARGGRAVMVGRSVTNVTGLRAQKLAAAVDMPTTDMGILSGGGEPMFTD